MVEKGTPYGYKLGYQFYFRNRRWMTEEECLNTAVEGLWEAARRFQPSKGFQFTTYAKRWVRQTLQRAKQRAMGIPSHLISGGGEKLEGFDRAARALLPSSLNATTDDGSSLAQTVADGKDQTTPSFPPDFWDRVNKWLAPRQQEVVRLRFVEGLTLEEAGEVLHLTRERVRQLEVKCLDTIERRVDFGDCLDQFTFTEHALV